MTSASALNALTSSLSCWEMAGYAAVAAVAVGVAGEVVHEFFDWFRSVAWWRDKGNKASALLLVVALVAELVIQVKTNSISGMIIASLEKEAASIGERAAEIERKYSWRAVLPKQNSAFLTSIGNRRFSLVLQYFVSDPEAYEFASRLKGMLAQSHLSVTPQNVVPLVPPIGIVLWGPDTPDKEALGAALTAAGFTFRSGNAQITAVDDINALRMSVGGRPPPQ